MRPSSSFTLVLITVAVATTVLLAGQPAEGCSLDRAAARREVKAVIDRMMTCWDVEQHPPGRYAFTMTIVAGGRGHFVSMTASGEKTRPSARQRACLRYAIEERTFPEPPPALHKPLWTPWGGQRKPPPMSLTMSFPVHLADADGKVPGLEEELEDDADDDRGISLEPPSPTEDPSSLLDPPNTSPVSLRPMRGCAACAAGSDNRAKRSALAWAAVLLTLWLARRKR